MNKTKYPILLVHGMGFRDRKKLNYWGRIPSVLEAAGNTIFYGKQDANATIETNAAVLAEEIKKILEETQAEKVNIIAHSKGGMDIRHAICKYHLSDCIASVTTINTPHNGSITMDKLLKLPKWMFQVGCRIVDVAMRIMGDENPNTYDTIHSFTTEYANRFNKENDEFTGIYCQSYGFVLSGIFSDMLMFLPHLVVSAFEGENDGLLAPRAVMWKNYRGTYKGVGNRGISHVDEIDLRRRRLSKKQPKEKNEVADITEFYMEVVRELAEKGM